MDSTMDRRPRERRYHPIYKIFGSGSDQPKSQNGHGHVSQGLLVDEEGMSSRHLRRDEATLLMFGNQVGLAILSLPMVLQTIGIVPGLLVHAGVAALTWYAGYELFRFYLKHPHVTSMVEMARVAGGRPLEIAAGILAMLQSCLVAASAIVMLSIALNSISDHGACTRTFMFIACTICFIICSLAWNTKYIARASALNMVVIFVAIFIAVFGLGILKPLKDPGDWPRGASFFANPGFRESLNACLRVLYNYSGTIAFPNILAEMKNPEDFSSCLTTLAPLCCLFYITVSLIVYALAGRYVTSPVLGSGPIITAQIAYGVAIIAVFTTGITFGHLGAKYWYSNLMKKIDAVHQIRDNSSKNRGIWITSTAIFWCLAFVIANLIPIFNSILAITSATTMPWTTLGCGPIFWLYSNKGAYFSGWKNISFFVVNTIIILLSLFINGAGLWSSITELTGIFASYTGPFGGVFSCENNAPLLVG